MDLWVNSLIAQTQDSNCSVSLGVLFVDEEKRSEISAVGFFSPSFFAAGLKSSVGFFGWSLLLFFFFSFLLPALAVDGRNSPESDLARARI